MELKEKAMVQNYDKRYYKIKVKWNWASFPALNLADKRYYKIKVKRNQVADRLTTKEIKDTIK